MATIINLGNFPKVASDAIEFSYFLSESEKAEWREWLKTATPEQQEELVDILYSMWQDNQKNAVPENLANNQNLNPVPASPNPPSYNQTSANYNSTQPTFNPTPQPILQPVFNPAPVNNFVAPIPANSNPFVGNNFATPVQQSQAPLPPAPEFNSFGGNEQFNNSFNQQPQPLDQNFNPAPAIQPVFNQNLQQPNFNSIPEPIQEQPASIPAAVNNTVQNPVDSNPFVVNNFVATPVVPSSLPPVPEFNTFEVATTNPFEANIVTPEPVKATPQDVLPKPIQTVVEPIKQETFPQTASQVTTVPKFDFDEIEEDASDFKNEDTISQDANLEVKKNGDISMESLVNDNKYRPNPILDNLQNDENEFVFKGNSEPKKVEKPATATPTKTVTKPAVTEGENDYDFNFNKQNESQIDIKKQDTAIEFSNLQDPGTKDMLNEIYNDYIETYDTNQKKFVVFLDRVTKVLSNYETISGHFENLTGKVININDKMVAQAQEIQALKDAAQIQGSPIQDQIDDLRYDLDNLEKEARTVKTEVRRKSTEVSQQMAALGADSYKDGGVSQKIELLKSEMQSLRQELNSGSQTAGSNNNNIPTKTSKLDLTGII